MCIRDRFISYGIYSRKIKTKNQVYIEPAHYRTCTHEKLLACIGDAAVNRVMIKGILTADLAQVAVDVDLALRPLKKVAAGKYADLVAQVADISPNSDDVKIYFEAWCAADERAERLESRT